MTRAGFEKEIEAPSTTSASTTCIGVIVCAGQGSLRGEDYWVIVGNEYRACIMGLIPVNHNLHWRGADRGGGGSGKRRHPKHLGLIVR